MANSSPVRLKDEVRNFWNDEPCGTRYLTDGDDFLAHAKARYALEPHIPEFAQFASSRGKRILEIGVGMGSDFLEWLKAGAIATGIDLSVSSVNQSRSRCRIAGFAKPDIEVADAENLPFQDNTFDIVYSYGVMHHSPDVQRCLDETQRVLKPGGQARLMLYHHPSLTGFMLWLRFGLLHGKSIRKTVYEHLESPGTKSFSEREVRDMMRCFNDVRIVQVFSPGDLLLHLPSSRFQGIFYRLVWKCFPRTLLRLCCPKLGLFLLISAQK